MLSSIKSIPRLSLWCRCLSASCKKDCHVMPLTLTDICCVITQSFKVCNLIKIKLFRRSIFILRKLYSETFHGGEVTIGYGYTVAVTTYEVPVPVTAHAWTINYTGSSAAEPVRFWPALGYFFAWLRLPSPASTKSRFSNFYKFCFQHPTFLNWKIIYFDVFVYYLTFNQCWTWKQRREYHLKFFSISSKMEPVLKPAPNEVKMSRFRLAPAQQYWIWLTFRRK